MIVIGQGVERVASTSGGIIFFGDVAVRAWSGNQAVIALSSGETEYYAALKGASAALGFQSMLRDLGLHAWGVDVHRLVTPAL